MRRFTIIEFSPENYELIREPALTLEDLGKLVTPSPENITVAIELGDNYNYSEKTVLNQVKLFFSETPPPKKETA